MIYKSGRGNLACTIFVPFDCNNHCPFCTSKEMYKSIDLNLEKILENIRKINTNPFVSEYVLTGGEPFANLDQLRQIVNACEKKIFINTTLPLQDNIDDIIKYVNEEEKIYGLNISRHIGFKFPQVADVDLLDRIEKPIRINTVINNKFTFEKFEEFIRIWGNRNRLINLRADYRKIDGLTLKNRDEVDDYLLEHYDFLGSTSCMVCNSERFQINEDIQVSYHRGLMYSSFIVGDKYYVNDVIITPDGEVHSDWHFETKEDEDFLKWLFNNPYVLVDIDNVEQIEELLKKAKIKKN